MEGDEWLEEETEVLDEVHQKAAGMGAMDCLFRSGQGNEVKLSEEALQRGRQLLEGCAEDQKEEVTPLFETPRKRRDKEDGTVGMRRAAPDSSLGKAVAGISPDGMGKRVDERTPSLTLHLRTPLGPSADTGRSRRSSSSGTVKGVSSAPAAVEKRKSHLKFVSPRKISFASPPKTLSSALMCTGREERESGVKDANSPNEIVSRLSKGSASNPFEISNSATLWKRLRQSKEQQGISLKSFLGRERGRFSREDCLDFGMARALVDLSWEGASSFIFRKADGWSFPSEWNSIVACSDEGVGGSRRRQAESATHC